ncbi:hypothetical protein FC758_12400 [Clostridium botulinum]|nr:hypothetical protein [Clostridium botulinum]NFL58335.1 hypothetical protein [Clostridium botulinum]NFL62575.1 hypothetical protein [Clostridium botulinum]
MNKEREMELMLNGFKMEVKGILQSFNEIMNATFSDTVTIKSNEGDVVRKSTLQDTIDVYKSEWHNTLELLDEIGITIENNINDRDEEKNNHQEVYDELVEYTLKAAREDVIAYLEHNNVQIPYEDMSIEHDSLGDIITLSLDNKMVASILLKKNTDYKVIDKIETGFYPLLVENI